MESKGPTYTFSSARFGRAWGKRVHARLGTETLAVQCGNDPEEHFPYASIRRVRLRRPIGRTDYRFSLAIALEDGRTCWLESPRCNLFSVIVITWWTDPTGTYAPFIRALHRVLLMYRTQVDFRARGLPRRFEAPLAIAGLGMFGLLFWLSRNGGLDTRILATAVAAFALGIWANNYWPTGYEPDAIPDGFLPGPLR